MDGFIIPIPESTKREDAIDPDAINRRDHELSSANELWRNDTTRRPSEYKFSQEQGTRDVSQRA